MAVYSKVAGVEGFTDDHLAAFKRCGTERILIAYDRHEAGDQAAGKLAQKLIAAGLECFRIQFPKSMDANDYALKVAPAARSLGFAIRKCLWMSKGAAPDNPPQATGIEPVTSAPLPALEAFSLAAKEKTPSPIVEQNADPLPAAAVPVAPGGDIAAEVKDAEVVMVSHPDQDARALLAALATKAAADDQDGDDRQ